MFSLVAHLHLLLLLTLRTPVPMLVELGLRMEALEAKLTDEGVLLFTTIDRVGHGFYVGDGSKWPGSVSFSG